ncbi:hypothetical protein ScPMuIL_000739 [Solemya velum]
MATYYEDRDDYPPDYSVLNAIDDIIGVKKLWAENSLARQKIDYVGEQLKEMLTLKDNRVLKIIRKKDRLMDNTSDTHEALATLRKEADELLIKRHIIEVVCRRVHRGQDLELPEISNWLANQSREYGNPYDMSLPLDQQLPDLRQLNDRYWFQQKIIQNLKKIVGKTRKMADQLVCHTLRLYNRLRDDQTSSIRRAQIFTEVSKERLENFDYYGYSPAGPIVPPIDTSWCSQKDHNANDDTIPIDISLFDRSSPVLNRCSYAKCGDELMQLSSQNLIDGRKPHEAKYSSPRVSRKRHKKPADRLDKDSDMKCGDGYKEQSNHDYIGGKKPPEAGKSKLNHDFKKRFKKSADTFLIDSGADKKCGDGYSELQIHSRNYINNNPKIPEPKYTLPPVSKKRNKKPVDISIFAHPSLVEENRSLSKKRAGQEMGPLRSSQNNKSNKIFMKQENTIPPIHRKANSTHAEMLVCPSPVVQMSEENKKELSRISSLQSSSMFSKQQEALPSIVKQPDILVCETPPPDEVSTTKFLDWEMELPITPPHIGSNLFSEQRDILPHITNHANMLECSSSPVLRDCCDGNTRVPSL